MINRKLRTNSLKNKNVIIGNFDLIHYQHKKLFDLEKDFVILTFKNIPRKNKSNINSIKSKCYFLNKYFHKPIYIFDVDKNNMSANEFVNKYLKKTKSIIVGSDFVFGNDFKSINEFKDIINLNIIQYNKNLSTTKIKELLLSGKIKEVNKLLPYSFSVYEKVVHGKKMGRQIGFRTINFSFKNNLTLQPGVYLTKTIYNNKIYKSITMFGKPKTIKDEKENLMETHIIDFNKIIYNKYVEVQFYKFLNPIKKYKSKEELIQAIKNYKKIATETNY